MRTISVAIILLVVIAAALLILGNDVHQQRRKSKPLASLKVKRVGENCTQCTNGESCCSTTVNGSSCCDGGVYCCDKDMGFGRCCGRSSQGTCCRSSGASEEVCCHDPGQTGSQHMAVCCIVQTTFCCPPELPTWPNRCCPRWSTCASTQAVKSLFRGGRYGCDNPSVRLPIVQDGDAPRYVSALFLEPNWLGNMNFDACVIDLSSGNMTQNKVSKSVYNPHGETPRSFAFDVLDNMFYELVTNETAPVDPKSKDPDRKIELTAIDPVTGKGAKTLVDGAFDQVTGYSYAHGKKVIVMATTEHQQQEGHGPQGYKFYHVDATTAKATLVSESNSTSSADRYNGWFKAVSDDARWVYRMGEEYVDRQENFGVGVTDLSKTPAESVWIPLSNPPDHNHFYTFTLADSSTPAFKKLMPEFHEQASPNNGQSFCAYCLAESNNVTRYNDLDLFLMCVKDGKQSATKKIAKISDAHKTPYFGPIQEALSLDGTLYTAIVDKKNSVDKDWSVFALVSVELKSGTVTEHQTTPPLLSETSSVAGLGIPHSGPPPRA